MIIVIAIIMIMTIIMRDAVIEDCLRH